MAGLLNYDPANSRFDATGAQNPDWNPSQFKAAFNLGLNDAGNAITQDLGRGGTGINQSYADYRSGAVSDLNARAAASTPNANTQSFLDDMPKYLSPAQSTEFYRQMGFTPQGQQEDMGGYNWWKARGTDFADPLSGGSGFWRDDVASGDQTEAKQAFIRANPDLWGDYVASEQTNVGAGRMVNDMSSPIYAAQKQGTDEEGGISWSGGSWKDDGGEGTYWSPDLTGYNQKWKADAPTYNQREGYDNDKFALNTGFGGEVVPQFLQSHAFDLGEQGTNINDTPFAGLLDQLTETQYEDQGVTAPFGEAAAVADIAALTPGAPDPVVAQQTQAPISAPLAANVPETATIPASPPAAPVPGPAGPQGGLGPQVLLGPQGVAGPAGPQGGLGPQGLLGPQGVAGQAGAAGAQGLLGPQGVAGQAGAAGAQGPAGSSVGYNDLISGLLSDPRAQRYLPQNQTAQAPQAEQAYQSYAPQQGAAPSSINDVPQNRWEGNNFIMPPINYGPGGGNQYQRGDGGGPQPVTDAPAGPIVGPQLGANVAPQIPGFVSGAAQDAVSQAAGNVNRSGATEFLGAGDLGFGGGLLGDFGLGDIGQGVQGTFDNIFNDPSGTQAGGGMGPYEVAGSLGGALVGGPLGGLISMGGQYANASSLAGNLNRELGDAGYQSLPDSAVNDHFWSTGTTGRLGAGTDMRYGGTGGITTEAGAGAPSQEGIALDIDPNFQPRLDYNTETGNVIRAKPEGAAIAPGTPAPNPGPVTSQQLYPGLSSPSVDFTGQLSSLLGGAGFSSALAGLTGAPTQGGMMPNAGLNLGLGGVLGGLLGGGGLVPPVPAPVQIPTSMGGFGW